MSLTLFGIFSCEILKIKGTLSPEIENSIFFRLGVPTVACHSLVR